jgi:hypothetical protein
VKLEKAIDEAVQKSPPQIRAVILNPAVDLSAGACNAREDVETGRDARRI